MRPDVAIWPFPDPGDLEWIAHQDKGRPIIRVFIRMR